MTDLFDIIIGHY